MIIKNRVFYYPIVIIGLLIAIMTSCKKDENIIIKDPIITWSNPADIVYGTPLSKQQLNATADVSGIFIYTPSIGTILNQGANQDLKVDFTPDDLSLYNSLSKTVKINVTAPVGPVIDIDGNVYNTVTIGGQTWMVENLKTTMYNDGNPIPNVTDDTEWQMLTTPAYCWYDNDTVNKATYGALYNWFAVNSGKLAPVGWHVSTDEDWEILVKNLVTYGYNYDGSITEDDFISNNKVGKALSATSDWYPSNVQGAIGNTDYPTKRNATGFYAFPCGARSSNFVEFGIHSYWWSYSELMLMDFANVRDIYYNSSGLYTTNRQIHIGLSVRCVKD